MLARMRQSGGLRRMRTPHQPAKLMHRQGQIPPRGLKKADAAAYCGCSEDAFDRGRSPALSVGTERRLIGISTGLLVCPKGRRTRPTMRWRTGRLHKLHGIANDLAWSPTPLR
ncbi:protein of unknown function [Bradyrhizobium vignae]|uniref:Uncharacterized protein n=1 Tax=Bradyrhizobium vignae TaxID=1549949 RepID=A0A2U3PVP2_9BRAD|nr:protein of unknown function [Bradyrhizobium vignae]